MVKQRSLADQTEIPGLDQSLRPSHRSSNVSGGSKFVAQSIHLRSCRSQLRINRQQESDQSWTGHTTAQDACAAHHRKADALRCTDSHQRKRSDMLFRPISRVYRSSMDSRRICAGHGRRRDTRTTADRKIISCTYTCHNRRSVFFGLIQPRSTFLDTMHYGQDHRSVL